MGEATTQTVSEMIANATGGITDALVEGLGAVNTTIAASAGAIIAVALVLFAIRFVPRFGMGLFKGLSH